MKHHNPMALMSIVSLRKVHSMSMNACERVHDAYFLEAYCNGEDSDSAKAALEKLLELEEIQLKLERELNKREMQR